MTIVASTAEWDAFVTGAEHGSYLQLSAWARVKAANGWAARRIAVEEGSDKLGGQVLVRGARRLPWAFGYVPRGPVGLAWSRPILAAWTSALRARFERGPGRPSQVRIDPEIELSGALDPDGQLRHTLGELGWRPAPPIQPSGTRIIDLRADEAALWSDLRKKWRQYVNTARTRGVVVGDAGKDGLSEFYAIYRETARRAGFLIRTEAAYRAIWAAFEPSGNCRLLLARDAAGVAEAALFLIRCGGRVVEPYGGMTVGGAASRANYLLKWEAIRSSRELGATAYDMWGLAHPGIAHFKTGFGGREVRYIGAYELVLDRVGRAVIGGVVRARSWLERRRHGLAGESAIVGSPAD